MSKYTFVDRHIGPRDAEIKEMLTAISYNSVEQLIADTIPETIRLKSDLNLPNAITENRSIEHIKSLAKKNKNICCRKSSPSFWRKILGFCKAYYR